MRQPPAVRYPLPPNRRYTVRLDADHTGAPPPWCPNELTLLGVTRARGRTLLAGGVVVDMLPLSPGALSWNPAQATLALSLVVNRRSLGLWLQFMADATEARGILIDGLQQWNISATVDEISYTCDVSQNAGASIVERAGATSIDWDDSSTAWSTATWVSQALRFTYGVKSRIVVHQPVLRMFCRFADLVSYNTWDPSADEGEVALSPEEELSFVASGPPSSDGDGSSLPTFPCLFLCDFDALCSGLDGALIASELSPQGTPFAVRGVVDNSAIVGVYQLTGRPSVFAVRGGQLVVDDAPLATSSIRGNTLRWVGLDPTLARMVGLPAAGELEFSADGATIVTTALGGTRLGGVAVRALPPTVLSRWPSLSAEVLTLPCALGQSSSPSGELLLQISPYAKSESGYWQDTIQTFVQPDLTQIILNYMPVEWYNAFVSPNPPRPLPSHLQKIAAMPGTKGTSPADFYPSVSYAFLTDAVSRSSSDSYAKKLNAPRARAWMKRKLASSDVWAAHGPALYGYHFNEQLQISIYQADQQANEALYAGYIAQDVEQWKGSLQAGVVDPTVLATLNKEVEKLATVGSAGAYWAYFLYRAITGNSLMRTITSDAIGTQAINDPGMYLVDTHKYLALLTLLDPSGTFAKHYQEQLQSHYVGTILPNLINPGTGPIADTKAITAKIVHEFIKANQGSTDPTTLDIIAGLQALPAPPGGDELGGGDIDLPSAATISAWCDAIVGLGSSLIGSYSWERLADRIESSPNLRAAVLRGLRCLGAAMMAANIYAFIQGVRSWSSLTKEAKAAVVLGGLGAFSQLAASAARNGVAYATLFEQLGWRAGARQILGVDACAEARQWAEGALSRWILDQVPIEAEAQPDLAEELLHVPELEDEAVAEVRADASLVSRFFGPNLSTFMATRVATVLSILGIAYSAYLLWDEPDTDDQVVNSLMLSSGILGLLAAVGGWAVAGGAIGETCMVASILPIAGFLSGACAAAGFVVLLVFTLETPAPDPVKEFGTQCAATLGFWMKHGVEVDLFLPYVDSSGVGRIGISIAVPGTTASPGMSSCVALGTNGSAAMAPLDYDYDTVLYVNIDLKGYVTFSRLVPGSYGLTTMVLAIDAQGQLTVAAPQAGATQRALQQWVAQSNGTTSHSGPYLESAGFTLANVQAQANGGPAFLALSNGAVGMSTTATVWQLTMNARQPGGLTYDDIDIAIYQYNSIYRPTLEQHGSPTLSWSIDPALPSFLQFDTTTGAISQATGVAPEALPMTPYTVTVQNGIGQATASLTIQVG